MPGKRNNWKNFDKSWHVWVIRIAMRVLAALGNMDC